jgi:hypothetical protein
MCAPYYVEFPVDLVTGVNWKKKDDQPPDDGGGDGFAQCGGIYFPNMGGQGGWMIGFFGIYDIRYPIYSGVGDQNYYAWNHPKKFTAEIQPHIEYGYGYAALYESPDPFDACNDFVIDFGLTVVRDTDPHIVAQKMSLGEYSGATAKKIEFDAYRPDESWNPILVVSTMTQWIPILGARIPCVGKSAEFNCPLLIQAICDDMTYGGPPPFAYTLIPPPPPDLPVAWDPPTGGWVQPPTGVIGE